jgi:hypothetical protein
LLVCAALTMDLQRIHIKILTDAPATLNLEPFLAIFGRWRAEKNHPAGWVDLADYAHVPRGAGIVLAGFNANFSLDMSDPAPGILYAAKKGLMGTHAERIALALRSCVELTRRLIAEPEFPKDVHVILGEMEFSFPDRLEFPNTPATDQELRPAAQQILDRVLGANRYEVTRYADPMQAYGFSVRAKRKEPLDVLLQRLS